jgi:hypothetical protein
MSQKLNEKPSVADALRVTEDEHLLYHPSPGGVGMLFGSVATFR